MMAVMILVAVSSLNLLAYIISFAVLVVAAALAVFVFARLVNSNSDDCDDSEVYDDDWDDEDDEYLLELSEEECKEYDAFYKEIMDSLDNDEGGED